MARIHLFELEDQDWFPGTLRNYGTDFLKTMAIKTKMFSPVVPLLKEVLQKSGENRIIDIASGAGGSLPGIGRELKKEFPDLKITLTDYYPNIPAYKATVKESPDTFEYVEEKVDASQVPGSLKGVRTHFLSLHHFKPEIAGKIIQNAIDQEAPVAFFEAQERSVPNLLGMAFSPLFLFLLTPVIKPFSLKRFFFTYLCPIVPLFVLWDGIVSCLRTYSEKEMWELVKSTRNHQSYDWKIGRLRNGPGIVLYLIGMKKTFSGE